jgi:hypothetical protein
MWSFHIPIVWSFCLYFLYLPIISMMVDWIEFIFLPIQFQCSWFGSLWITYCQSMFELCSAPHLLDDLSSPIGPQKWTPPWLFMTLNLKLTLNAFKTWYMSSEIPWSVIGCRVVIATTNSLCYSLYYCISIFSFYYCLLFVIMFFALESIYSWIWFNLWVICVLFIVYAGLFDIPTPFPLHPSQALVPVDCWLSIPRVQSQEVITFCVTARDTTVACLHRNSASWGRSSMLVAACAPRPPCIWTGNSSTDAKIG